MATIEVAVSAERFRRECEQLADAGDDAGIVAQQILQAGAVHAIEFLLDTGFSERRARQMLGQIRENLSVIQEIARSREIELRFDNE
jgi:hypothetical protein